MTRRRLIALVLSIVAIVAASLTAAATGSFSATTSNDGNNFAAAPDMTSPAVNAATVARDLTGAPAGYVSKGASFRVYAEVTDQGNPSSGISTVTADVSNVATTSPATLSPVAPISLGGHQYNFQSSVLTAKSNGSLAIQGATVGYSVTATDVAGNPPTTNDTFTATVDNPVASAFSVGAGGSTADTPDAGDTLVYTYSVPMDPGSLISGWDGASPTTVDVKFTNSTTDDIVTVLLPGTSTLTNIGSVETKGDYVSSNATFANSTISRSGNTFTVTLAGSPAGTTADTKKNKPVWTASTSARDALGTPVLTSDATDDANTTKF